MALAKWVCKQIDTTKLQQLETVANINPLLSKVLLSKGIQTAQAAKQFLYDWKQTAYDPYLMKDMDLAVDAVLAALEQKEPITVYGDYDCDGITSTAILVDFLRSLGGKADYYIPDRLTEGYGISIPAVDIILKRGTKLIITVDCGISAWKEVAYAMEQGCKVVVTDHHQCPKQLPEAMAVINPHRPDCTYPFKMLAGVGVTYKLIQAICLRKNMGDFYYKYVDLVSLGTVADVVSVTDENRKIVSMGVDNLLQTRNLGLSALVELSGIGKYKITAQSFAFGLSPRINAAGRMGNAELALHLILSQTPEDAKELAYLLDVSNKQRQLVESDDMAEVNRLVAENPQILQQKVLVLSSPKFHHGVAGIVAAKVSEQYHKPCILLVEESDENGVAVARGSARSLRGINIFELLTRCETLLLEYGGHALAAGLSLTMDHVPALTQQLNDYIFHMDDSVFEQCLQADLEVEPEEITVEHIDSLSLLEPFGHENENPVFLTQKMVLRDAKALGAEGKHLRLTLEKNHFSIDAIAFNMGPRMELLEIGAEYDILYHLENNAWRNRVTPQMRVIDFALTGSTRLVFEEMK